jgi:hypothetical protein
MKKYKFLIKPLFFIFNLLFATWLVIKIEQLSPSDFGKFRSLFEKPEPVLKNVPVYDKHYILKLSEDYKKGILSKKLFEQELNIYLNNANEKINKKLKR